MRAGSGGPTPLACERIRLRCSRAVSAGAMRRLASLPKPVFTPYTASLPCAAAATRAAAASTAARAPSARRAGASCQYSRASSASVTAPGVSVSIAPPRRRRPRARAAG